jgi:hypothetical protein
VIESPVAFLPGFGSLIPELFAKILTNQRMGIHITAVVGILSGQKPCPS